MSETEPLFLTDEEIIRRVQQIENHVLHEQAVLPGIIRELEKFVHAAVRNPTGPLWQVVEGLNEAASALQELRKAMRPKGE